MFWPHGRVVESIYSCVSCVLTSLLSPKRRVPHMNVTSGIVSHPPCPQAVVLLAPSLHLINSPGRVDCFLGSLADLQRPSLPISSSPSHRTHTKQADTEKEARIGTPGGKPAQSDSFNLNFGHRTKIIWLLNDVYLYFRFL